MVALADARGCTVFLHHYSIASSRPNCLATPSLKFCRRSQVLEATRRKARDVFTVFEHKENSKLIHEKDVATVVRCIGINPSEHQMMQVTELLKEGLEEGHDQLIPLERFQAVVVPWVIHNEAHLVRDDFHTLMQALRAFDPQGTGYIDGQALRTKMSTQVRGGRVSGEGLEGLGGESLGGEGGFEQVAAARLRG